MVYKDNNITYKIQILTHMQTASIKVASLMAGLLNAYKWSLYGLLLFTQTTFPLPLP